LEVHESGHAIVGHSIGLTIGEPTANYQGVVPVGVPDDMTEFQTAIGLATFYAAGQAAEREMLGSAHPDFGERDREDIEALKERYPALTGAIEAAVANADDAVKAHRDAIERLAKRLGTLPRVKAEELKTRHLGGVGVQRPPTHP